MRPPIITYGLFCEELLLWLFNPLGVNTLIQFLCLRFARQFEIDRTDWVVYLAPGIGLLLFASSSAQFTSWVRHRIFVTASPRMVLLAMRMSVVLWAVLALIALCALRAVYHHVSHGNEGDLVELYTNKPLVLTIITVITLFQLLRPKENQ